MTFERYVETVRERINHIIPADATNVDVDTIKDAKAELKEICNESINEDSYQDSKDFLGDVVESLLTDEFGGKINHILDDSIKAISAEVLNQFKEAKTNPHDKGRKQLLDEAIDANSDEIKNKSQR